MLYIKIKLKHLCHTVVIKVSLLLFPAIYTIRLIICLKNWYNLNPSYCCVSLIITQTQNSTFYLDQLLNTGEPADVQ